MQTARVLLQTTELPVTEPAFAAGFASIRQFNETMREIYAGTPSELRAAASRGTARTATRGAARHAADGAARNAAGGIPLRLAYRGPCAEAEMFDFLAVRAVPGVEEVPGPRGGRTYRRTLRLAHGTAIAEVDECGGARMRRISPAGLVCPADRGGDGGWLECRLRLTDLRDLSTAVQRLRRLFDLDADPYAVAERLGADPLLARLVAQCPGLRSPGAADPEELAVRTVLGGPPERAAGLVRAYGKPLDTPDGGLAHVFPAPAELAGADVPEPVRALCTVLADGTLVLDAGADRTAAERALAALPGVGPRAAAYIRMRGMGDPDVAAGVADAWRPWGAYALHHLWRAGIRPQGDIPGAVRHTDGAAARLSPR